MKMRRERESRKERHMSEETDEKRERHVGRERAVKRGRETCEERETHKKRVRHVFVCCVMCCGWAVRVVVVVAVAVVVCARVSFLIALQNDPVCAFKTLPRVPSTRPCLM